MGEIKKLYTVDFGWGSAAQAKITVGEVVKETPKQYQVDEYDGRRVSPPRIDKDAVNGITSKWHTTPEGAMAQAIARRRYMIEEREKDIALFMYQIEQVEKLAAGKED